MARIDHGSERPLYEQLRSLLEADIQSGALSIGARLPSERELADTFGVSRMTARQAVRSLAADGLVRARTGKGTFVDRPKIDLSQRRLSGFTEEMQRLGHVVGGRLLSAGLRPADADVADRLRLMPGADVVALQRLRSIDGTPLAIEWAHLDAARFPGLAERSDLATGSLYALLLTEYGVSLAWADQTAEADMPTDAVRRDLAMPAGIPVLGLRRVTYDAHDRPVEYVISTYRADLYRLRAVLRPPAT